MKTIKDINRQVSIKIKGVLYMMLLILVIYVSVSIVVLSSSRRNLNIQREQFHRQVAEKLAINAADAIISGDIGSLMEQIRQMKLSSNVKEVRVINRQGIIISSDDLENIGKIDDELLKKINDMEHIGYEMADRVFSPIKIAEDVLGGLEIHFDLEAEDAALRKEFRKTVMQLMYISLVIFAVGVIGSFVVSRLMTRPIADLLREIDSFEREMGLKYSQPYDPSVRDETVQLKYAFYHMIENLKGYLSEYKRMFEEKERLSCMAAIGQMSAQIAHEMRNSLYAIRGAISGIERTKDHAEIKDYLSVIKDEALEMTMMADEFLRFAKMPSPSFVLCRIEDIINKVTELLNPDLKDSNVKVLKDRDGIQPIYGDPALLKQAFMNLFMNSIQAMKGGGIIKVNYKLSGSWLEIYISDTGPGIPGEMASKIFQPFFTTKNEGAGLGLAIVYKIVLAHHGNIELLPSERGALFRIQLPLGERSYVASGKINSRDLEKERNTHEEDSLS